MQVFNKNRYNTLWIIGTFAFSSLLALWCILSGSPLTLSLGIPGLAMACSWLVHRLFYSPLSKLKYAVHIVQSGNLDYLPELPTGQHMQLFSNGIKEMTANLKNAKESIQMLEERCQFQLERQDDMNRRLELFGNLFNHSNMAVFICKREGDIIDVNTTACEMLGFSKMELVGMPFTALFTDEALTRSIAAHQSDSEFWSVRYESTMQRHDNTSLSVEVYSGITDIKNGILQIIVSDITQRKEIESRLIASEEKFRTFMETAHEMMFITDVTGTFTYVNPAMEKAFKISVFEFSDMTICNLICSDDSQEMITVQTLLADIQASREVSLKGRDGRMIQGEISVTGIFDNAGRLQGLRGIIRDITQRKKIEASQRLTQIGQIAANVIHEVKNQIAVIYGYSQMSILDDATPLDMRENAEIIFQECEKINEIVKRLLLFSRPSQGNYRKVDINRTVDFVLRLLEKQLACKNICINRNFGTDLPPVELDEKQIQEVFMNLLQNAAESMDKKGAIEVRTCSGNDHIQIDFKDNGCGIAEENLTRILDPFFTTKETGTGLGLSACYGIVKAHKGDIKYSSKPGRGTTASIILPLSQVTPHPR